MNLHRSPRNNDALPSLWWAGVLTVGLVWFVAARALPESLPFIDDRLVLHTGAGCFLTLGLLLHLQRSRMGKAINLLLQAVCASAVIAVDQSSSAPILNIIVVAQIPYILGIRPAVVVALLVNTAHVIVLQVFHDAPALSAFLNMALYACFQMFSLMIGHFAVQVNEARMALAAMNAELLATRSLLESSARDRERLRVSRELHDTAGHTLTALKLSLRQLRDRSRPEDRDALTDCLNLSSDLLEDIRHLVGNLRELNPLDLDRALAELTRPFPAPTFTIKVAPDVVIEDLAVAENLLAVARESITNVVRHSEASRCVISVRKDQGRICLTVEDDGVGAEGSEGNGIAGMRERVTNANGELVISPNSPTGTRVTAAWAYA
ncbi:MAG: sensor histidine kinase [Pseudomonadota bacterium]